MARSSKPTLSYVSLSVILNISYSYHNSQPLVNEVPNRGKAADINLTFILEVTTGKAIWNVNNVSFVPPTTPTLIKVLDGASEEGDFNVTENTFIFPRNKVVDITFPAK
jgi:hypothetical protein